MSIKDLHMMNSLLIPIKLTHQVLLLTSIFNNNSPMELSAINTMIKPNYGALDLSEISLVNFIKNFL
jgi:hypothetical protein